jgi:AcrR family transcriptional regulator
MSPPSVTIPATAIVSAALELVRASGLAGLSARAVASRLGTSVGPVYRAFESMEQLTAQVLDQARLLLDDYTGRPDTGMPFRNAGVGLVLFARDEPNLYRALFVEQHHFKGVFHAFNRAMEDTILSDNALQGLDSAARQELLQEMWTYSHGLAMLVITGLVPDASEEGINRRMGRIGFAVITALFGGDTRWAEAARDEALSDSKFPPLCPSPAGKA